MDAFSFGGNGEMPGAPTKLFADESDHESDDSKIPCERFDREVLGSIEREVGGSIIKALGGMPEKIIAISPSHEVKVLNWTGGVSYVEADREEEAEVVKQLVAQKFKEHNEAEWRKSAH